MKKSIVILIVWILVFGMTGCSIFGGEPTTEATVYAPDLTFQTMDGGTVKLSELMGKPVFLNFWASWCSPIKAEMPLFQEKYEELGDKVEFVVVCLVDGLTETVETGKAYIQEKGYTFPVYFDTTNQANEIYGVNAIPTSFFIAPDGAVLAYCTGALTEENFDEGIRRVTTAADA